VPVLPSSKNISTARILNDVFPKNTFSYEFGGSCPLPPSPTSMIRQLMKSLFRVEYCWYNGRLRSSAFMARAFTVDFLRTKKQLWLHLRRKLLNDHVQRGGLQGPTPHNRTGRPPLQIILSIFFL